ncbi:hypothetical protein RJ641_031623 [Dillenia turbinata]|uniref:Uncharacterized protein n=1 Tax=Dillenia turbinata TaxID=194707 RepID=A0AAN8ZL49_9MAGN
MREPPNLEKKNLMLTKGTYTAMWMPCLPREYSNSRLLQCTPHSFLRKLSRRLSVSTLPNTTLYTVILSHMPPSKILKTYPNTAQAEVKIPVMSLTSSSIVNYSAFSRPQIPPYQKLNKGLLLSSRSHLFTLVTDGRLASVTSRKMGSVVKSSVPDVPLPSDPSPNSWPISLIVGTGILLSIAFPFFKSKWGPFSKLKEEIKTVVETAEHITDAVEKAAEKVDEVAEEVAEHLPEGRLKNAISRVEKVAEVTAKEAHMAGEVIDKVEEVEKEVKEFMEPISSQTKVENGKPTEPEVVVKAQIKEKPTENAQ